VVSFEYNGQDYYYIKNLQGDVTEIIDSEGNVVVRYEYDAWGYILSITDDLDNLITGSSHVGIMNPMRYRGYYYDNETGLYYLQSRYYDAEVGRFVSVDEPEIICEGEMNLFAYCYNNPVNLVDLDGKDAIWLQNASGAWLMGHSGLLIQDSYGKWGHVYWDGKAWLTEIPKEHVKNLSTFNKYIESEIKRLDEKYGKGKGKDKNFYGTTYNGWIYLNGDFSEGYNFLKNGLTGKSYNIFGYNCTRVNLNALFYRNFIYAKNISKKTMETYRNMYQMYLIKLSTYLIPNNVFKDMFKNFKFLNINSSSQAIYREFPYAYYVLRYK